MLFRACPRPVSHPASPERLFCCPHCASAGDHLGGRCACSRRFLGGTSVLARMTAVIREGTRCPQSMTSGASRRCTGYPRRVDRDQIYAAIAQERRRIADLIDSLDEAQLATESLCAGWDVKTVAAHLVSALADGTVKPILFRLSRPRSSLDRVNDEWARRRAPMPAAEIAASLRDLADHQYLYPLPQAASARLAEVLSHSGDIRIPLGLPFEPDPQLTATALDFLTGPVSLPFVPWGRLRGLRLHATDIDRAWGKGQEIRGKAAELMMVAVGRTATLDALDGAGLPLLRQRILS